MDLRLYKFVTTRPLISSGGYEDVFFVDRLSYPITSSLLVIFSIFLTARQFTGSPIECWIPKQFHRSWEKFSENYCWVKNTYAVDGFSKLPASVASRESSEIVYYQWVPFILVLQAFMCYLPLLLWRFFMWNAGINLRTLVSSAAKLRILESSDSPSVGVVSRDIKRSISLCCSSQSQRQPFLGLRALMRGRYLSLLFLIVELVLFINCALQLLFLKKIMKVDELLDGGSLSDVYKKGHISTAGPFPTVTMCDVVVRRLGQPVRETIQCVLPINLFNKVVFVIITIWLLFLLVVKCLNFLWWFCLTFFDFLSSRMVHRSLTSVGIQCRLQEARWFLQEELTKDGMFIIYLIRHHTNPYVARSITKRLWDGHQHRGNGTVPDRR